VEDDLALEGVLLIFPAEWTHLRKPFIDQDGIADGLIAGVRDHDAAAVLVAAEELVVKEHPCVGPLTDLLLFINDEGKVSSDGAFDYKREVSLKDHGPGADAITDELDDEEAASAIELWEAELFSVL